VKRKDSKAVKSSGCLSTERNGLEFLQKVSVAGMGGFADETRIARNRGHQLGLF